MLRGAVRLARPIPLVTWTATSVALGAASASHFATGWLGGMAAVTMGGVLLQGYVTHGLNDLYDWASGTDRTTPGTLSGGSHAIREGLLQPRDLRWLAGIAGTIYLALLVVTALWRSLWLLPLGLVALAASALYSVPPARLCYRPWWGEWAGIFPALVAGVLATGLAVAERAGATLVLTAFVQGILCIASVMEHHLADIESDWEAVPRKRTSPAYWQKTRGRSPAEIAAAYDLVAAGLAVAAAETIGPRFWWSAGVAMISCVIAWRTRVGELSDEIRRDWWLKAVAVAHALGYVFLAAAGIP